MVLSTTLLTMTRARVRPIVVFNQLNTVSPTYHPLLGRGGRASPGLAVAGVCRRDHAMRQAFLRSYQFSSSSRERFGEQVRRRLKGLTEMGSALVSEVRARVCKAFRLRLRGSVWCFSARDGCCLEDMI